MKQYVYLILERERQDGNAEVLLGAFLDPVEMINSYVRERESERGIENIEIDQEWRKDRGYEVRFIRLDGDYAPEFMVRIPLGKYPLELRI